MMRALGSRCPTTPPSTRGGAAYLAAHIKQLLEEVRNSVVLSAGDNVGASPLDSALFHDEPTMALMNELGLKASVIGNHELDEGYQELLRMQLGGCHPTDGCRFRDRYPRAKFPILGGNVYLPLVVTPEAIEDPARPPRSRRPRRRRSTSCSPSPTRQGSRARSSRARRSGGCFPWWT